jgi:hypothetical protein
VLEAPAPEGLGQNGIRARRMHGGRPQVDETGQVFVPVRCSFDIALGLRDLARLLRLVGEPSSASADSGEAYWRMTLACSRRYVVSEHSMPEMITPLTVRVTPISIA